MKSLRSIPKEVVNLMHAGEPHSSGAKEVQVRFLLFDKAASILRTRRASVFYCATRRARALFSAMTGGIQPHRRHRERVNLARLLKKDAT
jgi:hypothetical protein